MNGHSRDGTSGLLQRTREEARFFWSDVVEIRGDLQELAAKEVELLRAEVAEQVKVLARIVAWGVFAAVAGLLLLAFLFVTLMFALDLVLATWLAALITSLVLALLLAVAGMMAYQGLKRLTFVPKRTINSVKEDAAWARSLTRSSGR